MLKAEAKRLQEKAKAKENLIDRLKDNLLKSVTLHGNIKTDLISVSSRKTKSVQITDEAAIPAEFMRIKTEPNKTAIKDALEAGEEVQGALIVENFSLMIK
jgi:uncharacterized metal-binding protein YceD (DUF177 family)